MKTPKYCFEDLMLPVCEKKASQCNCTPCRVIQGVEKLVAAVKYQSECHIDAGSLCSRCHPKIIEDAIKFWETGEE